MTILATLVYIIKDGKTLMIHRNRKDGDEHLGKYNGLGGKLESGETLEECAKREVLEESGLTLTELTKKGDILFPKFDKYGNDWHVHIYTSNDFTGELNYENREGDLAWHNNADVPHLNLWEGDKMFISNVYQNKKFTGIIYYNEGKLDKSAEHRLDFI